MAFDKRADLDMSGPYLATGFEVRVAAPGPGQAMALIVAPVPEEARSPRRKGSMIEVAPQATGNVIDADDHLARLGQGDGNRDRTGRRVGMGGEEEDRGSAGLRLSRLRPLEHTEADLAIIHGIGKKIRQRSRGNILVPAVRVDRAMPPQ